MYIDSVFLMNTYLIGIVVMYFILLPEVIHKKRTVYWYLFAGSLAAFGWPIFITWAIYCIVLWTITRGVFRV